MKMNKNLISCSVKLPTNYNIKLVKETAPVLVKELVTPDDHDGRVRKALPVCQ
jgi:hypothetical protein